MDLNETTTTFTDSLGYEHELDIDGKTRSIVIREISDPSEETTRSSR